MLTSLVTKFFGAFGIISQFEEKRYIWIAKRKELFDPYSHANFLRR